MRKDVGDERGRGRGIASRYDVEGCFVAGRVVIVLS